MTLIVSSCNTTERLNKAATAQGKIQAGIALPAWPDDCQKLEPHASVEVGSELRSVLVRERNALDRQNARTGRCGAFYDDIKTKFGSR
ncbi:hypothetical protein [Rhizobium sp. Root1220]|uniref:hypothetical protein n=1 Tax=Rhizobium sp. Root1220 TaxID=1736432 RepID=UPI0007023003|nr:hypothetical protein [Rhizobium sp. Root1220]KQV83218.1 hypothetical protein ASC90_21740 [Rhizobium sp. Root1220]